MSVEEATFQNMQSEEETLTPEEKLSPEVKRISGVLENCISQVKIAASLPAILQIYGESAVLDQDLSRALQTHQVLVERLEKLEGQQPKQTKKEKGEMVLLKNDVKNSVRDALRCFRTHSDGLSGLRAELNMEEGESESMLIGTLEKFHDCIVENLMSGPDENTAFSSSHKRLRKKEDAKLLKQQKELEQLEKAISKKHRTIGNLQKRLDSYDRDENKTGETESALPEKQDEPDLSPKLTGLNQERDQLNAQLNKLMLENHQEQLNLQEKNKKLEMETESLLQTFDENIEKLQAELEVVEKEYDNKQEEMRMLQEHFSLMEVRSNEIQEERRLAEETRKEELWLLELKNNAAVVIQAWWRGYSIHRALKNKGKNMKEKKKSSSKAKSKKKK